MRADAAGTPIAQSRAAVPFTRLRVRLLRSLRLLARPPATQISHLTRLGLEDSADELRLQFEEVVSGAEAFIGRDISSAQAERLHTLVAQFRAMTAPDLWTDRALRRSSEWARVRELAAEALVEFDAWPRRWGKKRRRLIRAGAEAAKKLKDP